MKKRKIPYRMCVGCLEMKPSRELLRVVKNKENIVSVDLTGKANGRGAYLCKKLECLKKAQKGKKLEKAFESPVDTEIYNILRGITEDVNEQ